MGSRRRRDIPRDELFDATWPRTIVVVLPCLSITMYREERDAEADVKPDVTMAGRHDGRKPPIVTANVRRGLRVWLAVAALALVLIRPLAATLLALVAQVPTPEAHFGFQMGADRQLAGADAIDRYVALAAAATDRVKAIDIGATTEGHRTIAAIVSAPENIRNLDAIRAANQRLADPRTLAPEEARRLAASHKVVVAIGASIHASEVGGSLAAIELLYWLASATDPRTLDILENVVVIVIPSLNPDGLRTVVDWYDSTRNTSFEGVEIPRLYHKYAGHELNRDAFMMNLVESRNLARFFYTGWHPQIFLSMHQMAPDGPRMFVPPMSDPVDPNYDPVIWREAALLGGAMALELQQDGRAGVISNALYDYYWPGYEDSAPLGHNTVCLLTEVARVRYATPMTIAAGDLHLPGGLATGTPGVAFPNPWPGGQWSLRDIVEYDLTAARGMLSAAALYRERLVRNFYEMGARAIETGARGGPFAFLIPPDQYDPSAAAKLEELLLQGGIEIHRAVAAFDAGGASYPAGTDVILLAQPYRAYVKTLLERQNFPGRRLPDTSTTERPYDVAGWTLPAQMGVDVRTIDRPFEAPVMSRVTAVTMEAGRVWGERKPAYYVIDARGSGAAITVNRLIAAGLSITWTSEPVAIDGFTYAAGSLVVPGSKTAAAVVERIVSASGLRATGVKRTPGGAAMSIGAARIGVYKAWFDNADEGWTRWVLDRFEFRYSPLVDADVRAGDLRRRFDAIVLPSAEPDQMMSGNAAGAMPPEFTGGLGVAGIAALRAFVESGGTLVCLDQACALAIAQFQLPIRDVVHDARTDEFFCPGSIVKIDVDPRQPGGFGVAAHTGAFFASSAAYETTGDGRRVHVIARYGSRDVLLSGWLEGEQVIAGKAAAVEVSVGTGRIVLLGFPVQHRGQSLATFRLLFNALFTAR